MIEVMIPYSSGLQHVSVGGSCGSCRAAGSPTWSRLALVAVNTMVNCSSDRVQIPRMI